MKSNPEFKARLWHSRVNAVSIGRAGSVSTNPSPTLCRRALTMRGLFLIATLIAVCAMSISTTDVLAQAVPPYTDSWGKKGKNLGSGDNAGFHKPYGVTVDPAGYIYVADTANYRIQKFSPRGKFIWSFGKKGAGPGQFNLPTNVQVDGFFRIYVADYYNNRIEVFDRYQ
ncbi:MAG TPA: NHL repeat-containing protein, partial [Arenicellales bacterium]|nr:NHL repeat-containing protein [Arenicellales bacterium]